MEAIVPPNNTSLVALDRKSDNGGCDIQLNGMETRHNVDLNGSESRDLINKHGLQNLELLSNLRMEVARQSCATDKEISRSMFESQRSAARLEALIIEKSHSTESLIRAMEESRLREDLTKTREELNFLKLRASLPPTLTPAVAV